MSVSGLIRWSDRTSQHEHEPYIIGVEIHEEVYAESKMWGCVDWDDEPRDSYEWVHHFDRPLKTTERVRPTMFWCRQSILEWADRFGVPFNLPRSLEVIDLTPDESEETFHFFSASDRNRKTYDGILDLFEILEGYLYLSAVEALLSDNDVVRSGSLDVLPWAKTLKERASIGWKGKLWKKERDKYWQSAAMYALELNYDGHEREIFPEGKAYAAQRGWVK